MIAIIDYDAGNTKSVEKAVRYLGYECELTRDPDKIRNAERLILPGVGAFGDAMGNIRRFGLEDLIKEGVKEGKPFLGICLGLQLIFATSEESEGVRGLDLVPGSIIKLPPKPGYKIPHMGWNSINIDPESRLFAGIPDQSYVYFVHSYYLDCKDKDDVAATAEYTATIDAAVEHENIFACQFHPEKSGETGLKILKNFCNI
ncbi:MAG: imidazole glycerol phosphate synthase subunit HisH [Lachnospiraceae bacterium]|jgi:glutamine amidotransferase|nr:imidazole glycerol phosphate synthase subunit HisH [Lachnospiraceae bacterium]MEE3461385.1 imidazole glycerol phosphate synthase subunit HisH [Lachnospiraceae bacterium]